MLAILWLLTTRRRMTARELADELELHVRTVYRYIDALCASGVPIEADIGRHGGYALPEHFRHTPLFFDREEQAALVHAAAFAREAGYPNEDALDRSVAKIKRYASERQLRRLEQAEPAISAIAVGVRSADKERLRLLDTAATDGRTVELEYRSGYDEERTRRSFDPYGLVHWRGNWYAVGHCRLRQAVRVFRVDRIRRIRPTDSRFGKPEGFSARQTLLDHMLPDDGLSELDVELHIEGSREALRELSRHPLLVKAPAERTDASVRFRVDEDTLLTRLPYLLLAYGGRVNVVEPRALRERMAEIAHGLYERYRDP